MVTGYNDHSSMGWEVITAPCFGGVDLTLRVLFKLTRMIIVENLKF